MKYYLYLPILLSISTVVLAEPTCNSPKEKWINESTFKKNLETKGFKVKNIKITNGCYELYGYDKSGKRVERSFDPATGTLAK